jgi:hypothetical protein
MATLADIERAIEQLNPSDRAKLAQWWQENFDPDEGLVLRDEIAAELDTARQQIARGEVADWEQLKRPGKTASR